MPLSHFILAQQENNYKSSSSSSSSNVTSPPPPPTQIVVLTTAAKAAHDRDVKNKVQSAIRMSERLSFTSGLRTSHGSSMIPGDVCFDDGDSQELSLDNSSSHIHQTIYGDH